MLGFRNSKNPEAINCLEVVLLTKNPKAIEAIEAAAQSVGNDKHVVLLELGGGDQRFRLREKTSQIFTRTKAQCWIRINPDQNASATVTNRTGM